MRLSRFAPAVFAVLGGVGWALCFGVQSTVVAPWVALVPLILLLRARQPFLLGWLYGISYWLAAIPWIVATMETYGGLARPVAIGSLLLLSTYLGLYCAVFAGLGSRLWRRSSPHLLWSLPALWVVLELIRAWLLSGFPWNLAAYAWTDVPGALELSAWIGAYGISFVVVAVNVAVAHLVLRRQKAQAAGVLVTVVILLALGHLAAARPRTEGQVKSIRIVQPNTPILTEWDRDLVLDGYGRLMTLSIEACDPGVLVIWPESAAWPFLIERDPQLRADVERLNGRGCSLLLNSIASDGDRRFNSAFLFDASGETGRYDKGHLVPFGEYVPLGGVLPFVRRLARAAGDFSPGDSGRQLVWSEEQLGVAICFEIVFAGEVAARVRDGSTLLVTITNDGWYGDTAAPWQHFRAARFRAAENRRPLVRAALTGISAIVSPRGAVEQLLTVGEEGVLEASLAGVERLSFYSRFSWLVPAACWLLLAFAILRSAVGKAEGEHE